MSLFAPRHNQDSSSSDSDSQPNNPPPPIFHPNNNIGVCARIKGNLLYLKTTLGILKIVSVVFGIIASGLIIYGYKKATLFERHRSRRNWRSSFSFASSSSNCRRSNSSFCGLDTYFEDRLCHKPERNVTVCVNLILVILPDVFVLAICLKTVVVLLVLLVIRRSKHRRVFQCDTIGHSIASFLVIVSGLCLIGYFVQVMREDLCGTTNLKVEATDYVIYEPEDKRLNAFEPGGSSFRSTDLHESREYSVEDERMKIEVILANLTKQCPEKQREKYYHWHFLFGGIFAVITGIVYIVIAAFSRKEASQAVEPVRMIMGPNGPQLWPPPPYQA